jgi:glycerol-3-phosphate dehydrogenase
MYTVCSQFAICSFGDLSVTTSNMTTRNIRAMMQGVEGDTMLKRKAYLGLLAVAIAVVSVAPAFAQQTGKTRVVSDEVRERCRA